MLVVESLLLQTLQNGFATLAANPVALGDLFNLASPLEISRLQTVLGKPRIIVGFPPAGASDNTVGITLGSQEEAEQPLGLGYVSDIVELDNSLLEQEYRQTFFQNTWRVSVYSTNGDLAVHLSYIVKYILLTQRMFLGDWGLLEQRISMGDFEPIPQYLPDVVFVRAVMFTAKTRDIFTTSVPFAPITDVEVTINNEPQNEGVI